MADISRIVYECVSSAGMRTAINRAYGALFEGLSPPQKTRRALRQMLPEPPGGWESPALDTSGNPLLTAEHARLMSNAECLEYSIRNMFFHDGGRTDPKFEPGVARIAYTELGVWPNDLGDWRGGQKEPEWKKVKEFAWILRNISESHSDDYSFDLNGMSFDELATRFAHGSAGGGAVNDEADGSGCRYNVTWIPNFATAQEYLKYTEETQPWCLTKDRAQWDRYMKGNTVKMYICTRPGFESVPGVPGKNCPLDDYGLSMIGVSVNPDGSLDTCCTRWNHLHGGSDMAMDEEQLCKVLNVRQLSDVCPPYTEDEIERRTSAPITQAMAIINNPDSWNGTCFAVEENRNQIDGITIWAVHRGNSTRWVAVDKNGQPAIGRLMTSFRIFGDTTLAGEYNPYDNDEDWESADDRDSDYDNLLIFSATTGTTKYLDESHAYNTSIYDIISYSTEPNTYDYRQDQLIHGVALGVNVDFEGLYLYDAAKGDFLDTCNDLPTEDQVGNMFTKDNFLFLVTRDGIKECGSRLAQIVYPGMPTTSDTGRRIKWCGTIRACSKYPTIAAFFETAARDGEGYLPGFLCILDPIRGNLINMVKNVKFVVRVPGENDVLQFVCTDSGVGTIRLDGEFLHRTTGERQKSSRTAR